MGKISNVITVPTSTEGKFFKYWLEFLKPFHRLTDREIDVTASFLKQRYELGKVIKDNELLDKIAMNEDTKRKIREDCNISQAHFQVIMTKLKKSKVIENGKINPKFIPKIQEDSNSCQLLLVFEFR